MTTYLTPALALVTVVFTLAQAARAPIHQRLSLGILACCAAVGVVGFLVACEWAWLRPGPWSNAGFAAWAVTAIVWTVSAQRLFGGRDDGWDTGHGDPDLPDDPDDLDPEGPDPDVDWDAFERDLEAYAAGQRAHRERSADRLTPR